MGWGRIIGLRASDLVDLGTGKKSIERRVRCTLVRSLDKEGQRSYCCLDLGIRCVYIGFRAYRAYYILNLPCSGKGLRHGER